MATQTTKTNTTFSKENQAFALWKQTSKDGKSKFLSNKEMIAFYNTNKKNPKEPDLRVYNKDENGKREKDPCCSLWCNVSKDGKTKYLSGKYHDRDVVGFIATNKKNEKQPHVSVWYREEKEQAKETPKPEQKQLELEQDDLPF